MLHRFCFPFLLSELERKGKEALHMERLEKSVTHLSVQNFFCQALWKRNFGIWFEEFRRWIFFFLKKVLGNRKCISHLLYSLLLCLRLLIFLSTFSFILWGFQFLHVLANHGLFFFLNWPYTPSHTLLLICSKLYLLCANLSHNI